MIHPVYGKDPYGLADMPPAPISHPVDLRPRVICEKCLLTTVERRAAFSRETVQVSPTETISVKAKERAPRVTLKVEGDACHVCGDNSPRGTFPKPQESHWSRFGECGSYVWLYNGPDGLWSGNAEEFAALKAKVKDAKKRAA